MSAAPPQTRARIDSLLRVVLARVAGRDEETFFVNKFKSNSIKFGTAVKSELLCCPLELAQYFFFKIFWRQNQMIPWIEVEVE